MKRRIKSQERNKRFFFNGICASKPTNSTATISHWGILPLISRKAVPLWHCIGNELALSPLEVSKPKKKFKKTNTEMGLSNHLKIVHLNEVLKHFQSR